MEMSENTNFSVGRIIKVDELPNYGLWL